MVTEGTGAEPSKYPINCAPLIAGRTCARQRMKLSRVSFSATGMLKEELVMTGVVAGVDGRDDMDWWLDVDEVEEVGSDAIKVDEASLPRRAAVFVFI